MSKLDQYKRKAALLFKSEKRLGAKEVMAEYTAQSFEQMKANIISQDDIDWSILKDVPRIKDLTTHLNKVKAEFIDQSEINYYHATLIVLLRREYQPKQTFAAFEKLWETETDFLLNTLSLRWIISACDTFVDYANCPVRSAIFMNAVTLINTLKAYETEAFIQGQSSDSVLKQSNIAMLLDTHLPLYDGLTYFRLGSDDTLKHMRARYQRFSHNDKLATTILLFVFDNIQSHSSAFKTLKNHHFDEKSAWW